MANESKKLFHSKELTRLLLVDISQELSAAAKAVNELYASLAPQEVNINDCALAYVKGTVAASKLAALFDDLKTTNFIVAHSGTLLLAEAQQKKQKEIAEEKGLQESTDTDKLPN